MNLKKSSIMSLFFTTVLLFSSSCFAAGSSNPKINEALAMLKQKSVALGEAKLDGINLFFGTTKINGNYTIVDEIKAAIPGCTATFFVKKGADFMRISTNVVKDDGNRAVGTVLDPTGAAIKSINANTSFYGVVDILGKKYDTAYEPIVNAAGETIGIYYVGFPL